MGLILSDTLYLGTATPGSGGGSSLPDQTGHSGEFLTTDGTAASWAAVEAVPEVTTMPVASSSNSGVIVQFSGATGTYTNGYFYKNNATTTASSATASQTAGASLTDVAVVVATFETQITTSGSYVFTSDGSDWSYDGNVVDLTDYGISYTGTPVADDAITVVYTAESTTYAWERIDVQPSVDPLPSQTGNSGKFLTTNGTAASWATVDALPSQTGYSGKFLTTDGTTASWGNAIKNNTSSVSSVSILGSTNMSTTDAVAIGTGTWAGNNAVAIGKNASAANQSVALGESAKTYGTYCVAIYGTQTSPSSIAIGGSAGTGQANTQGYQIALGCNSKTEAGGAIQIGKGTNSTAATLQIGLTVGGVYGTTTQYRLLDSDGTIPTDRYTTTPVADGTYVPTLTISSGVATRSWAAPSGGAPTSTTATLAVNDWSANTQTVTVQGVTASNTVFVAPAPASNADYVAAGIVCTAQGAGTLTFTCTTTPSSAITVNVCIFG